MEDLAALKETLRAHATSGVTGGATSRAEQPGQEKSICCQNHHVAADLSKALKHRETIKEQVRAKQQQIDELIEAYHDQVNAMKEEYRVLRDCLDSEQHRMVSELKDQKAALKASLQEAETQLDIVHKRHMQFCTELPNRLSEKAMDVDAAGGTESPTHSPRSTGTVVDDEAAGNAAEARAAATIADAIVNDGGFQELSGSESDGKDKDGKDTAKKAHKGRDKDTDKSKVSSKMHVDKPHLKEDSGDSSQHSRGSRPCEETPSASSHYIVMTPEERNFVMKAVEQPALLQDDQYVGSLELALGKYSLTLQEFTAAIQQHDNTFFARLHTVQQSGAGNIASSS